MKKALKILFITVSIIVCCITVSHGFGLNDLTGDTSNTGKLVDAGNNVVKIITTIGVVTSVAVMVVLGIKYMMGSAEEKATYKKSMLPYVIGAGLVFATSGIAQIVYEVAKSLKL